MTLVQNFPFYSIIIAMFSGILSLALNGRRARNVSLGAISLVTVMSFAVCLYCMDAGASYTYRMGHFPAPWGNEIRAIHLVKFFLRDTVKNLFFRKSRQIRIPLTALLFLFWDCRKDFFYR